MVGGGLVGLGGEAGVSEFFLFYYESKFEIKKKFFFFFGRGEGRLVGGGSGWSK